MGNIETKQRWNVRARLQLTALVGSLLCCLGGYINAPKQEKAPQIPLQNTLSTTSPQDAKGPPRATMRSLRGTLYRIYRVRPDAIQVIWRNPTTGAPYQTLPAARAALDEAGHAPSVLINAGIYEPGYTPTGLHIENHVVQTPLNLHEGRGNFFMQPNGVFRVQQGVASIHPSSYEALLLSYQPPWPRIAIQSGPLLLHMGVIPNSLKPTFKSRKHRNAVCVHPSGDVFFVLSTPNPNTRPPTLYTLAQALRDLACTDGLYLDGTISCALDPADSDVPSCAKERSFAAIFSLATPPTGATYDAN